METWMYRNEEWRVPETVNMWINTDIFFSFEKSFKDSNYLEQK